MVVKMIQDLRNRMEKMQEMFTKDLQELKNKQIEMNNTLEGINSRITEAEEWSDLEDRMVKNTATEQNIGGAGVGGGWREMKTAYEMTGTTLNAPTITL